ncbi:MAG TPA: CHRD domain-containing protein [Nitrososphaeraceae archaeon]
MGKCRFAAILTGREEVPVGVDTLDTALATFQLRNDNEDLKYSVKVTDINKIKEVHIDRGKPM